MAKAYTRRTPEAARTLILDAADRVFATLLPDKASVRDIAAEAGISHGLVTHYFKTFDNLVSEVIERRLAAARTVAFARLGTAAFGTGEAPLLDVLLDLLEDTTLMRLLAWSLLNGTDRTLSDGQLARLVDAMHARLSAMGPLGARIPRKRIEMSVAFTIATVAGWSVAGSALSRAMGHAQPYSRAELHEELTRMIRAHVLAP